MTPPGLKPDELREAYLSFFESKGHTRWPSDSLVPGNDPTLLFTGAGMNQFKEMFLGVGNLPFRRATTAQKCLRTGDLDNVGRTFYHQTFFEMLGNFSFGDYFKREAILWQWEFLTKVIRLPVDRLWVSVYLDDDEAYAVWEKEVGIRRERIWRLGAKDNFWPANAPEEGPNGPCGPCSEVFYDFGSPGAEGDPEAKRYCEIGNIVFTQFNRTGRNQLEPLRQKNIDTGMGFERILAVLHGVRSNFETGLFLPIIRAIADESGQTYTYDHPMGQQFRRIAEHTRAAVFLVADGVKPSNEGRGYVARRILRRAVRDGIALGIDRPFLHAIVPVVVQVMGTAYPEVARAQAAASAFLKAEEEKFRETFETGMALLEREIAALGKEGGRGGRTLQGETAFVLYDTHGFPLELCEEICAERGISVDRAGFERSMEAQRERSREGSSMHGEVFVATAITAIKREVGASEFVGYTEERASSEIAALIRDETPVRRVGPADGVVRLIARATPFYAESGGQVGDTGEIEGAHGLFLVEETRRIEGYILHSGRIARGFLERGERIELRVDGLRRWHIRRNHTATHLLHAALRTVLGTHVTQAGSLVDPERLRFDFTHPQAVRPDEASAIERWVNDEVLINSAVETANMPLAEARSKGAMALFGEKYGDIVRVVTVGERSRELCGGIHVRSSAEIGAALLVQEGSVASGVRRIEMVTGLGALELATAQRQTVRGLADRLKSAPEAIESRVEALQSELRELRREVAEAARQGGAAAMDAMLAGAPRPQNIAVVVGMLDGDEADALRSAADAVRQHSPESVLLLLGLGEGGAAVFVAVSGKAEALGLKAGEILQGFCRPLGGKGGGKSSMAQGRVPLPPGGRADLERALGDARGRIVKALTAV